MTAYRASFFKEGGEEEEEFMYIIETDWRMALLRVDERLQELQESGEAVSRVTVEVYKTDLDALVFCVGEVGT